MTDARPLLIAGATGYAIWPANTLEGALRCLNAPVDGIEIDVQLTADGHVIAHHDYRLSPDHTRLDGAWLQAASPPLKDMTLAEIVRHDIGRTRPGAEPNRYPDREQMDGVRAPTLAELLRVLRASPGPRRLIYVEIKTDPTDPVDAPDPAAIVEATFAALEAEDYVEHAKIIAFDWQVLRMSEARSPGIRTAHLTLPALLKTPEQIFEGPSPWMDGLDLADHGGSELAAIKAHGGMEWSPYFTDVTPETVAEARALGLLVGAWGLSKAEDIARMAELGVYSSTVSGASWGADAPASPAQG